MEKIAIVGAGPGGLLCARMLQEHGIEATVYDADASADARDAGGSLDLHADFSDAPPSDPPGLTARRAAERALAEGYVGRVVLGHVTALAALPPAELGPLAELLARVQALVRRATRAPEPTTLTVDTVVLDLLSRRVTRDGKALDLRPRELRCAAALS